MDFEQYRQIKAINASSLKKGVISMKHMRAEMTAEKEDDTPAMRWGRLVHLAVLEPFLFTLVPVFDGQKRGKAWESFKDEHEGLDIITQDEFVELSAISSAVHANPDARNLISESVHEVTAEWSTDEYGKAKARMDGWHDVSGIIEVKTTSKIIPELFAKQFVGMGYDIGFGWYAEGAHKSGLSKKDPCGGVVIVIESDRPYDVCVYKVPSTVMRVGQSKARKLAETYRQAEARGVFAGVSDGIQELVMPSWYGERDVMLAYSEMSAEMLGM